MGSDPNINHLKVEVLVKLEVYDLHFDSIIEVVSLTIHQKLGSFIDN